MGIRTNRNRGHDLSNIFEGYVCRAPVKSVLVVLYAFVKDK